MSKNSTIAVIDYNMSNMFSIENALIIIATNIFCTINVIRSAKGTKNV